MSSPVTLPPPQLLTEENLPYDDDEPSDSQDADLQVDLLASILYLTPHGRQSCICASQFVYYEPAPPRHPLPPRRLSPDLCVVLNTAPRLRKSWVRWAEGGRLPAFVVELLSERTEARDLGEKKNIYEGWAELQDYVLYDPIDGRLEAWHRVRGQFVPVQADAAGRYRLVSLDLWLVRWDGTYRGFDREWLRLADQNGRLLPTPEELATQESERRADAEAQHREAHDRRGMAEAHAREEAARRVAAEARTVEAEAHAREEAHQRAVAEARAREEADQRAVAEARAVDAEARLVEVERQLAELQARLSGVGPD